MIVVNSKEEATISKMETVLAKKLGFRSKMLYLCRNISGARLYESKLSIALLVGILIPTHLQCVYRIANPDEQTLLPVVYRMLT